MKIGRLFHFGVAAVRQSAANFSWRSLNIYVAIKLVWTND
jgi:hypothetical protein